MRRFLITYNAVLVTILTVLGFAGANSLPHLIASIIFFPLAVYFWLLIIPRQFPQLPIIKKDTTHKTPEAPNKKQSGKQVKNKGSKLTKLIPMGTTGNEKFDLDRRAFLRLIGSAGVSVFMLSIFTKKSEATFFGSVPGPGTIAIKDTAGNLIDPAEKTPTDGYNITEIDDGTPSYYGYVEKGGAWYIIKEEASGAYRYAKGASNFASNWTGRAGLTYGYFDEIF